MSEPKEIFNDVFGLIAIFTIVFILVIGFIAIRRDDNNRLLCLKAGYVNMVFSRATGEVFCTKRENNSDVVTPLKERER